MRDKFEAAGGAAFQLAQPHGRPEAVFHASSADHAAAESQGGGEEEEGEKDGEQQPTAAGGEDEGGQLFASTWAAGGWLLENPVGECWHLGAAVARSGA